VIVVDHNTLHVGRSNVFSAELRRAAAFFYVKYLPKFLIALHFLKFFKIKVYFGPSLTPNFLLHQLFRLLIAFFEQSL